MKDKDSSVIIELSHIEEQKGGQILHRKSITQGMAYRESLMKYAEKYGVSQASGEPIFISGRRDGMEGRNPWLASLDDFTAILTNILKKN